MNIILLCSGNLGLVVLKQIHSKEQIIFVFTDKASKGIIDYCCNNKLSFFSGNPRTANAKQIISSLSCEILLSVNYLFIVEQELLDAASCFAINLHGSLLPKYRGRTPHVWAIINGESETGISAHLMTAEVDNGPVIKQVVVKIEQSDTGDSILQKYNKLYPEIVQEILLEIRENKIIFIEQDHTRATYFGKRTPEDGNINWNWQKERIRNWIRAQANPYPGAFTYYDGQKVIVNEIEFSDYGFSYLEENGKILKINSEGIIVKTSNGAIKLTNYKTEIPVSFKEGKVLIWEN
ncbi:MAG: methionyl-tRNA formyltransferase [Bacteroidetes bacterium]|nr:methionyl-tRNA formyltransferase [Bacteroidota bacterium]MBS1631949.1 methionyl-tRNA formyltransferase [Bacteroidota bacterium]